MGSAILTAGCGDMAKKTAATVAPRAQTGSETLLEFVPDSADAVFEVEVAHLRENQKVGDLVAAIIGEQNDAGVLAQSQRLVICSFGIGDKVQQLVLVEAKGSALSTEGGTQIADSVFAFGPPELLALVGAVQQKKQKAMIKDLGFLRLRAAAMPEKAGAAGVRATARLGFDARVALANALDVDSVPTSFSVWADVADDAALIAILAAEDPVAARQLARSVSRLRDRLRLSTIGRLGPMASLLANTDNAEIEVVKRSVRIVWVLPPSRLSHLIGQLMNRLGENSEDSG